jgi:transposase InsO family protein
MMLKVLGVSSSGYYKWLNNRQINIDKHKELDEFIRKEFSSSKGTYGSPRICLELLKSNFVTSKNTVARRMVELKLVARPKKKFVHTTDSDHKFPVPENVLNRNFEVSKPNTCWVSDITYIRVAHYWTYLTVIIDLADRMVVSWCLSTDMTAANTVIKAFNLAAEKRKISKCSKLIFHSDRGVQYACNEFVELLNQYNVTRSMSRKGNCWDNAVAESFFKTIKIEALNKYIFSSQSMLYTIVFRYIEGWYNTVRIHSALGCSPIEAFFSKSLNVAA